MPAPADIIVAEFVDQIIGLRPSFVKGVYLTGSIALDDFYPAKSDIDFIVLCHHLPDAHIVVELEKIHRRITRHDAKPDLSGSYIPSSGLQSYPETFIPSLTFRDGRMWREPFELAPVRLHELRTRGIAVYGPGVETLPLKITREHLDAFLCENINTYWTTWLKQHADLAMHKGLLVLFPRLTEWAVLGVARLLYTLDTGQITSKTAAGQ
jgi:hypothetical protein